MSDDTIGYDINDKDIEKMLHILETFDKPNATPNRAIDFLKYLKTNLRTNMAADDINTVEEQYWRFVETLN